MGKTRVQHPKAGLINPTFLNLPNSRAGAQLWGFFVFLGDSVIRSGPILQVWQKVFSLHKKRGEGSVAATFFRASRVPRSFNHCRVGWYCWITIFLENQHHPIFF